MDAINLGPFALPTTRVVAILAVVVYVFGIRLLARRNAAVRGVDNGALLAAALASRGLFVISHWSAYRSAPLATLFVWQGGFSAAGAIAGAAAWTLWVFRRRLSAAALGLAPIAAAVAFWAVAGAALEAAGGEGPTLPALSLARIDGDPVDLATLAGRPVVLNVWATWCPPCRRELVRQYLAGRRIDAAAVALDPEGRIGRLFGVRALPATLFFDPEGRVAAVHVGEISRAALEDAVTRARGTP